jgi:hypothetical protein
MSGIMKTENTTLQATHKVLAAASLGFTLA